MKNLSLCLFVLALSAVGCESKPAPKTTAPVMPPAGAMAGHAGAVAAPAEKKEGEAAAPAEGEKKEGEAAPAEKKEGEAAPAEKKEGEAAAPAEGEKKE
ncbi:MAG: hypothetical protein NTZ32_13545 [Planctomycetales bacterium]|nr:hypothetical protein [Planctomycetales bacterium]